MSCCAGRQTGPTPPPGGLVTMVNIGAGAQCYVSGTGPNPFELRTFESSDNTVTVTQLAQTINLQSAVSISNEGTGADVYDVTNSTATTKFFRRLRSSNLTIGITQNATDIDLTNLVALANEGGSAEVYDSATSTAVTKFLRTLYSSDTSLTVTQQATRINLQVPAGAGLTLANEGTGADVYDVTNSTATNKLFRRLRSTDSSITVTQNATDINLQNAVAVANEGGFAQVYDTATSTAILKNLRTIQSSDASVTVVQNATNIDLRVAATPFETYFSEKTDIVTTNGTAYVVVSTMDSITGGAIGEVWTFVATCLICHPSGLTTVNSRINWQIETSAGVWADLETDMNTNEPQTIAGGQRSSPRARTYQATLAMATPRLRLRYSMSAAVATGGQVEYAKVSGYRRS